MDPITLVTTALASGATAALKDTATQAMKDAYAGLKVLIQQKFGERDVAKTTLEQYVEKPKVWEAPLQEELTTSGAAQDETILAAAQELMKLVDPTNAAQGKYQVDISGDVQGLVQGDQATVTMNFGQAEK